ncbi:sensor histidine kinase [Actinacidiphila paucisporea]|nr:histidine kinase [Actinacidiphila paucisporea]
MARSIMSMVLVCYLFIGLIAIYAGRPSGLDFAVEAFFVGGVIAMQYLHSSSNAALWTRRRRIWSLGTQGLCVFLPLILFDQRWGGGAGFLAGSCLLLFSGRGAWALSVVPTALVLFSSLYARVAWEMTLGYMGCAFLTGLVVYGMSRLSNMVAEVHSAREEMARMAVMKERLRIASDLHDLLGYSLSAIVLKGELTRRLIDDNPERALAEIRSVLEISRQALSDIRTVAQGYRDMSLVAEAASAQALLAAAGIEAAVSIKIGALPRAQDTILASALREGVTNMLRHGDVRACEISAVQEGGAVRLEMVNDGLREPAGAAVPARTGIGLESIERRVSSVGGSVSTSITEDGRFHLVVTVLLDRAGRGRAFLAAAGRNVTGSTVDPRGRR